MSMFENVNKYPANVMTYFQLNTWDKSYSMLMANLKIDCDTIGASGLNVWNIYDHTSQKRTKI